METYAVTTYIDARESNLIEGTHIAAGLFPYAVEWAEGETEKTISIAFLDGWNNIPANAALYFLSSDMEIMNRSYGDDHRSRVNMTLYDINSAARYYFQGNSMVTELVKEYKYSENELLIEVRRELVAAQSYDSFVDYALTFDYDPAKSWQRILAGDAAEIGTHINDLSGRLYFYGDETVKYISVTLPENISMPYGSKYVNVYLCDPSDKTYVLRNWDYDGKFDVAKIKITNDTTPVLEFGGVTTSTVDEGGFEKTYVYPLSEKNKKSDVFGVKSVPYASGVSQKLSDLYLEFELKLYSQYDLSSAGVIVRFGAEEVESLQIAPYTYYYTDFEGDKYTVYNYVYVVSAKLNAKNPLTCFTLDYSDIASAGLDFTSTNLLLSAESDYFMSGCEAYKKQLSLVACSESAEVALSISPSAVLNEGAINVRAGDVVYFTVRRSSLDACADTMFFQSGEYTLQTVSHTGDWQYYYQPLDETFSFAPYEKYKRIAFVTRNASPDGESPDASAATATIRLTNAQSENLGEITAHILLDYEQEEIDLTAELMASEIKMHKLSGEAADALGIRFTLPRAYGQDISFTLSGLDLRLGNLTVSMPQGQTSLIHYFEFDETDFIKAADTLNFAALTAEESVITLHIDASSSVNTVSESIAAASFSAVFPQIDTINEDGGYMDITLAAMRSGEPTAWTNSVLLYYALSGTAVYGSDYTVSCFGTPKAETSAVPAFDRSSGLIIIPEYYDEITLRFHFYDNSETDGNRTLSLDVFSVAAGHRAYTETMDLTVVDNDYQGDFSVGKLFDENGGALGIRFFRENHTECTGAVSYNLTDIIGLINTDYLLKSANGTQYGSAGTVFFGAEQSEFILYLHPQTETGENAVFDIRLILCGQNSSLKQGKAVVSLDSVYDVEGFTTVSGDRHVAINYKDGNYRSFLLNYTAYYSKYLSGATVKAATADIGFGSESIYLTFDKNGLTRLSSSARDGSYAVPSGINPNCWYDINGDGVKELIFVSNLDSCFGGAAELFRFDKFGVFALDITDGSYTSILSVSFAEAQKKHYDVYIYDADKDGDFDAAVFSSTASETPERQNGENMLYILTNENGAFTTAAALDNYAVVSGRVLSLYAVSVLNDDAGRNYLRVYYYIQQQNNLTYCMWADVMSDSLCNYVYTAVTAGNSVPLYIDSLSCQVSEGESVYLKFYNDYRVSGSLTVILSGSAVAGINYYPSVQTKTLTFNGERVLEFSFKTLNNNTPDDGSTVNISLSSEDFVLSGDTECSVFIKDVSAISGQVAYTVFDGFNENYESSAFITGDKALASIELLKLNGISVLESQEYNVRFSASFGGEKWIDGDGDGKLIVSGLESVWKASHDNKIAYKIEFLSKTTNAVYSHKIFYADYRYFDAESDNCRVEYDVNVTSTVYAGQKLRLSAECLIYIDGTSTRGAFVFVYTNSADNRTYTFNSDGISGLIDAQIDFGAMQGRFSHSYTLSSSVVNAVDEQSGDIQLNLYQDKMDFPISIYNSVKKALLTGVTVEVQGINVNYHFKGKTNFENGSLTLTGMVPLREYYIEINGDNDVPYFDVYRGWITPSLDETGLSAELPLIGESTLDNISLYVFSRDKFNDLAYKASINTLYYAWLFDYFSGRTEMPSDGDEWAVDKMFNYIYRNPAEAARYAETVYAISADALIAADFPQAYKSLTKNEDEITLICYRYNPETVSASVFLSGTELTSQNCVKRADICYSAKTGGECVEFYAFSGAENCIIDIVVESGLIASGTQTVQLANFGTGLGAYLMQPVQEVFASLGTAPIPDGFAFINGMSFLLSFTDVGFASDYDEENRRFSIYMGASKDIYEASHGMKYDEVDRPSLSQLRAARSAALGTGHGQGGFGVGLGGKMVFEFTGGEWKLLAGEIYFSVSASYNYTKYILLPVISIPAFFSATVSLDIGTTIYFDWDEAEQHTDVTGDLAMELAIEIECGIGIKGFLSASVYGRAGIEIIIQMESGASKLTLYVEGGVRIQIIFWKYQYSFGRAEWSTQSGDYVERNSAFATTTLAMLAQTTEYSGVAKLYNASGELTLEAGLADDGTAQDIVLVSNVYESGAPKLAELGDGTKMIAWINYDETRGVNNAEVINYIYYDGENWSDVKIADETPTADLGFEILVYDGTYAILCTEVNEELDSSDGISDRLLKSDVVLFVFDAHAKMFEKTVLTQNGFNDRQAVIDVEGGNGMVVVYRSENTDINDDMSVNDFLCGENAANKLYYAVYDNKNGFGDSFELMSDNLPPIANMTIKILNGLAYVALECDWDGDFDTSNDREIVLIQYVFATARFVTTRVTDNSVSDTSPELAAYGGKIFMSYRSGDDVMYWYENQSYYICTLPQSYSEFSMFASDEHAVLLFTASVEGVAQVFASAMDAESGRFSAPSQITFGQKPARSPAVSLLSDGFTLYYCADTYTLVSDVGQEIDFTVTSEIATKNVSFSSDLSIEILTPDYSLMRPDEAYMFTLRVRNAGLINVTSALIKAFIGDSFAAEATVPVVLGNGYTDVALSITLSNGYGLVTFTVEKDALSEDGSDNSAQTEVLLYNAAIAKDYSVETNADGSVTFSLAVANGGAVDISNLEIRLTGYSNPLNVVGSRVIALLRAGEEEAVQLTVAKASVLYNANNEMWLKVYAVKENGGVYQIAADDFDISDNVRGLLAARQTFDGGSMLAVLTQTLTLSVGSSAYFDFVYTGDGEINVSSGDPSIFSVNGRVVTALKAGTANLSITDGFETKTITVIVTRAQNPSDPEPENPTNPENPPENGNLEWWEYLAIALSVTIAALGAGFLILVKKGKIYKNKAKPTEE